MHVDKGVNEVVEDLDLRSGLLCKQRESRGDLISEWFQSVHALGLNAPVVCLLPYSIL